MRQLVQPDGIATSTEDADKLTGSLLVVTLEEAALAEKISPVNTARMTEGRLNIVPILFLDRMDSYGCCVFEIRQEGAEGVGVT